MIFLKSGIICRFFFLKKIKNRINKRHETMDEAPPANIRRRATAYWLFIAQAAILLLGAPPQPQLWKLLRSVMPMGSPAEEETHPHLMLVEEAMRRATPRLRVDVVLGHGFSLLHAPSLYCGDGAGGPGYDSSGRAASAGIDAALRKWAAPVAPVAGDSAPVLEATRGRRWRRRDGVV